MKNKFKASTSTLQKSECQQTKNQIWNNLKNICHPPTAFKKPDSQQPTKTKLEAPSSAFEKLECQLDTKTKFKASSSTFKKSKNNSYKNKNPKLLDLLPRNQNVRSRQKINSKPHHGRSRNEPTFLKIYFFAWRFIIAVDNSSLQLKT